MTERKKPFPVSLLLIAALLLIIYFMNGGKFGESEGTNSETGADESLKDTTTIISKPNATIVDTVSQDTILSLEDTVSQQVEEEEKEEVPEQENTLTYNSLYITKKQDTLYFSINDKSYTNLLAGIAESNFELPFRVKLAGNLTYAEEREIKDILEEKELNFTIVENL